MPLCVRLPYLRENPPDSFPCLGGDLGDSALTSAFKRLWPGHGPCPDDSLWHEPSDYPFSREEAEALLAALRSLDSRALEDLRIVQAQHDNAQSLRLCGEWAELGQFVANPATKPSVAGLERMKRLVREQAHKVLLWGWLQEERLGEITDLLKRSNKQSADLAALFAESEACGQSQILQTEASRPKFWQTDAGRAWDIGAGQWRTLVQCALHFLGSEALIYAEGAVAQALEELNAVHKPLDPELGQSLGLVPLESYAMCILPGWRVLGLASAPRGDLQREALIPERCWIFRLREMRNDA